MVLILLLQWWEFWWHFTLSITSQVMNTLSNSLISNDETYMCLSRQTTFMSIDGWVFTKRKAGWDWKMWLQLFLEEHLLHRILLFWGTNSRMLFRFKETSSTHNSEVSNFILFDKSNLTCWVPLWDRFQRL